MPRRLGSIRQMGTAGVRIPTYGKKTKASSGAEEDAKSAEVETHKTGHRSDLSGRRSSMPAGKFWNTKCDIMLRLV